MNLKGWHGLSNVLEFISDQNNSQHSRTNQHNLKAKTHT